MKFLKGLALTLLSFLLFLSLAIFGFAFMLNNTLLNPDFVVSQVDRLDVSSLAGELIGEQLPQEQQFLAGAIDSTISDLEPWLKEQVRAGVYSGYDYFLGESQSLSLKISLEPLKESLRDNLRQAFMQQLPPQLSGLPQTEVEKYFEEFYQQMAGEIPSTFEFDESSIPPDAMAQITQVRQGISYFQLGYKALIGFMVLLVLGIILINREVKATTRGLGVPLLTYGALGYAGILATKYLDPTRLLLTQLPLPEIPLSLQTWLSQLTSDFIAPMEKFSLGLLVGGIVLIIVSFVYRRRREEEIQ